MLTSLRARLLLIGIGVALFAVVVVGVAVQRLTEGDIRASIERDLARERDIQDALGLAAAIEGGWDHIADDVQRLSVAYDQRIALADGHGTVIADSEELRFGRSAPLPRQAFALDPTSLLLSPTPSPAVLTQIGALFPQIGNCIELNGGVFTIDGPATGGTGPAEAALTPGAAPPGCFAPGVGAVPGAMPIPAAADPTIVADVPVGGDPAGAITVVASGTVAPGTGLATAAAIPQVQLFVGYGDRSVSLFPSPSTLRFWLAIGLPLLAAAGAMYVTSRRLLRPIESLTVAAERMHAGDLATRVDVRGRDELARLGGSFNEMAGALQAADQARRTLTSDVAHELRSPLANLRGWLEGIQDGVVEPTPTVIGSLHEEAANLQALVEDLQDLSLADSGHLALHRQVVDLADLLRRAAEPHRATATVAGVELLTDLPERLDVDLDPRRFRQVIGNLVSNAVRHTSAGGMVTISLRTVGAGALVSVTDTGEGIAPEHLGRVFERFWRADASRTRTTGGTGLGLAIARQLVVAHGGDLTVESELGCGTTFVVSLPLWAAPSGPIVIPPARASDVDSTV